MNVKKAEEPIQDLASHGMPHEKGPNLSIAANSLQQKPEMTAIYFYFYFGFLKASVNMMGFDFEINYIFK